MDDLFRFFLIGLGAGSLYAILAIGVTLVYRGSGIVNFAQGAFALVGAAFFYETRADLGVVAAIVGAVVLGALAGTLTQLLIMRPMRHASPLARVVATLGVMLALQEGAMLRYGPDVRFVRSVLPSGSVSVFGTTVGQDRLWILAITILLTAVLWVLYRTTRFGLATTGVAENELAMVTLGWSPNLVAACNWAAGGGLAGLAGALLVPIVGLHPVTLTLTVVPALAAALIGGFRSFPVTLAGGLLIGVLEAEATNLQARFPKLFGVVSMNGLASSVPFIAIIVVLVVRGQALPLRGHLMDRLPRLGTGIPRPRAVLVGVLVLGLSMWMFTDSWVHALITTGIGGLVALSLVVVTGYAGQISLAQYALAGVGALISSRMGDAWGVPFPLALVAGVVLTIPVGLVVAIPALRARGANLAVATLGMSVVIGAAVLTNPSYTGGILRGTVVPTPTIFGWSVDSISHPARYAGVVLGVFFVGAVLVGNLRRGPAGRRLIAVRSNERAAASLGVNVVGAKLYAFGLGAALAALAGVLAAFRYRNVNFGQFTVMKSIEAVLMSMIGGIGYIVGAFVAGVGTVSGVAHQLISHVVDIEGWFLFVAALLFLVTIIINPDGAARDLIRQRAAIERLLRRARSAVAPSKQVAPNGAESPSPRSAAKVEVVRMRPRRLEVSNLTVRFGPVVAVDDVSFHIEPGEVLGLIGPNGAGKTTIVDAISGFLRRYEGRVAVDGQPLDGSNASKRARAGLTRSFQSLELFDDLTVAENLRAACEDRGGRAYFAGLVRPPRPGFSSIAQAAIEEFGLDEVLDRLPTDLPYAQRRAVAIARAVATAPSVLLLDEPAAGLDEQSTRELAVLVRRLADDWGIAVLLIEHDVSMVLSTCDRVLAINFGSELATGSPDEVRQHPAVIASYLGSETPADGVVVATEAAVRS